MSRYIGTKPNGNHFAYGLDRAIGYFYDEWDVDPTTGEDRMLVEICTAGPFRNANRMDIVAKIDGIALDWMHTTRVAIDLPF